MGYFSYILRKATGVSNSRYSRKLWLGSFKECLYDGIIPRSAAA